MSAEEHLTGTPEGRPADQAVAHSYFVGRRASQTAEVYEVTATGVERLRSTRRSREESLDWRGSRVARMELSRLLIRRVLNQRPSRDLQARFALYVLGRLPEGPTGACGEHKVLRVAVSRAVLVAVEDRCQLSWDRHGSDGAVALVGLPVRGCVTSPERAT